MRKLTTLITVGLLGMAPTTLRAQTYGDATLLVDYWYRTYLRRAPDPSGMAAWSEQLNRRIPPDQVLSGILGSAEYYGNAGSNPAGYVTRLYEDILRRSPSSSELSYWIGRLYVESRDAVADEILIQNPGLWVNTGAAVAPATTTPPVIVTPGIRPVPYGLWNRDRRQDWYRHHDLYDYRRPESWGDRNRR